MANADAVDPRAKRILEQRQNSGVQHYSSPLSNPNIVPDPYPVYAALADKEPVHWCDGLGAWAIMKHADCLNCLNNARLKAERMESVLSLKFPNSDLASDSIYHRFTKNVMMYTDPPLHDALRKSTHSAFTHAAHEHYNRVIEEVAKNLIRSLPQSGTAIDAVEQLAAKMPVHCAVHAFGVPEEDLDLIVPKVNAIMSYWSGPADQPLPLGSLLECLETLHAYVFGLLNGQRGQVLPETVIARLLAGDNPTEEVAASQTIHQLVLLLIALFAPTTPGSISSGILSFANNPEQAERLLADGNCAANIANEVVRYNASNQFTWRVASEAIEISGVQIEAGQAVVPFLGAANRDPHVFDRPNEFNLGRGNSARHLSFGSGIHSCLGRQIAAMEISWFFLALFNRFSRVYLAGSPEWNSNLEFRSLRSLPVSFS